MRFLLPTLLAGGLLAAGGCKPAAPAEPAPCLVMSAFQGNAQTGFANQELSKTLIVRVLNDKGQPAVGVPVTWQVTAGDGAITVFNEMTSVSGDAEAAWVLGTAASHRVECRIRQPRPDCPADTSVAFTATALGLSIGTPTGQVMGINTPSCGNSYSALYFNIPYTTTLALANYYVEIEVEVLFSNSSNKETLFSTPTDLSANFIQKLYCVRFSDAAWVEQSFVVRLYARNAQGQKTGPALFTSNKSAVVRIAKPAGAGRIAGAPPAQGSAVFSGR